MQPNESILKKMYPIILLTGIILASVVLLSFTNAYTSVLIKGQQDELMRGQLQAMFPEMTDFVNQNDVFIIKANGKDIGYAFTAAGNGYGGPIQILVALQDAKTVKAISIIAQTETKGLGSRVELPSFTGQFAGKSISDIKLRTEGGQIDGFSGSTVSSRAVVNAVRDTALEKVAQLPK